MSEYFSYFPKTDNDLTQVGQTVRVTNILKRFKIKSDLKDRADVFYEYDIQEGDRPDTIAEKYYGNANMAWLVLHFNNIVDPIFGWHLNENQFNKMIKGKYGSIPSAQSTVHEYRQVIREASVLNDGTRVPKRYVVIDKTTYDTLSESVKESISKYDYEIEENDKRRKIKILDKRYLNKLKDEVRSVLKDNI
jgi:hypothetical protein